VWKPELRKYTLRFDPAVELIRTGDTENDILANTARPESPGRCRFRSSVFPGERRRAVSGSRRDPMFAMSHSLSDRRDGRAAQRINMSSVGVTITADEAEQARAIVRELVGDAPILDSAAHLLDGSPAEQKYFPLLLSVDG
jgi:hypothetical protein